MNRFLKSVRSGASGKNDLIKKSITQQLSDSVKEIQYFSLEENRSASDGAEAANQFCTIVEALFLHGLKDSFSHRFKRAIADVDERPEPSFWAPLLVVSHRQIIDQITNLTQITSEVGQCRAWIRQALNDCLLSSYLVTMKQDSSALKSFYNTGAFVRDGELLDVAQQLIEGVETCKTFTLPCNSSLLNVWPLQSLYIAGIWAPTLKACPVAPCDDVAQSINETQPLTIPASVHSDSTSLCSAMSLTSQNYGLHQMLSEDEVLKIILEKDKKQQRRIISELEDKSSGSSDVENKSSSDYAENVGFNVGNSLSRPGWSQSDEDVLNDEEAEVEAEERGDEVVELVRQPSMEASFTTLIESYNMLSGGFIKTPDLRDVLQKFDVPSGDRVTVANNNVEQSKELSDDLFNRSESLAVQVGKLAREKGMDLQNYECAGCKSALVTQVIQQQPKMCAFTGDYFCDNCMSEELISIPARIIHNWDYKHYSISLKGFNYINEIKDHPVVDFKLLNPYIYSAVQEMAHLQTLRTQLNFLRAYLYTCREPIIEQLQKLMYPREYMYKHIHQYSISDLLEIQSGGLAQHLEKVVSFGKDHVLKCWLCSQKGFVCEVCNKSKALFPFDVEYIYRCEECNGVYHKECLNASKPCPKCKRRKERDDVPEVGAIAID